MQMDLFAHKTSTMQLYRRLLSAALKEHDLTQMEMDVLLFLANHPQFDTARDLVEVRHLSKSQVSTAVEDLATRGFLQRRQKPDNKKLIHLKLLPPAAPAIRAGQAAQREFFSLLFVGFSTREREQLNALLARVEHNAEDAFHRLEHEH